MHHYLKNDKMRRLPPKQFGVHNIIFFFHCVPSDAPDLYVTPFIFFSLCKLRHQKPANTAVSDSLVAGLFGERGRPEKRLYFQANAISDCLPNLKCTSESASSLSPSSSSNFLETFPSPEANKRKLFRR